VSSIGQFWAGEVQVEVGLREEIGEFVEVIRSAEQSFFTFGRAAHYDDIDLLVLEHFEIHDQGHKRHGEAEPV
jgi:hypothetical protein